MIGAIIAQQNVVHVPPSFADVVFLSHFDGSDNATTAADVSLTAAAITFQGGAQLKTAQKKFGTASLRVTAVTDAVTMPANSAYDIGTGDFTVECFLRPASFSAMAHWVGVFNDLSDTTQSRWRLATSGTDILFQFSQDGSTIFTAIQVKHGMVVNSGQYHVAVSRYFNTLRLFIDGVLKGRSTVPQRFGGDEGSAGPAIGISIGGDWNHSTYGANGYIDEPRVTRSAWYRSDDTFTPPASAFSGAATGTSVLAAAAATIVGTGTSKSTGTGALAAQASQVAGTPGILGSGVLVAGAATVAGTGEVWATTFSQTLNADSTGWNGFNLREVLDASLLSVSGSKFRLTLSSGSAASATLDGLYAGHAAASGDAYDFDGTQVPVTVGATQSFVIPSNSSVVTDHITYALDETKNFIVAAHFSATSTVRGRTSVTGANAAFKSAANETSTSNVSTYTGGTGNVRLVAKIEVLVT